MRALAMCWPIPKLANIASQVLLRIAVLIMALLAGVDFSSDYISVGAAVSASLISSRYMFRAAMCGERRGGAAFGISDDAVWAVGTFGEGMGADISSIMATLNI